jgi:tetratricopeptide (TPR) repeat protein
VTIFEKSGQPASITEGERAIQLFTDRGALVRLFCERLHAKPPIERILFIHGYGGNGKTLALRYLRACACKHLPASEWRAAAALTDDEAFRRRFEECPNAVPAPWVGLDFAAKPIDNDRPQEAFYGLLMLRRQLAPLHLDFPRFDFAVLWYLRETKQLTRERVESLFPMEELDLVTALADVILDIPWIGVGKAVLGLFNHHLGERFALYRARRRLDESDVQEIQRLPANPDLIDLLPDLFARDLSVAMALGGAPERLVLAFDTHEALWGQERDLGDAAFFARDAWLRRLLGNLELGAGIVPIVAGRDRPRWPEAPAYAIPAGCLDVLLVGNLSDADARDYLARAGVTDATLCAHLADYTGGHPYFLGLCADVVLAATARGVALTPDDFEAGDDLEAKEARLVERLLKYVDRPLDYAVRALSAARAFDWDIYAALGNFLHFETSEPGLQALAGFSFVLPVGAPGAASGRYRIHELLRRLLADDPTTRRADACLEAYYRSRDDEPSQAEAIYHAFRQDPERGTSEWYNATEAALAGARYSHCERLVDVRREMPMADLTRLGRVLTLQGEYHAELSQYEEACQTCQAAVTAFDQVLQRAPNDIAAQNGKAIALCVLADLLAGQGQEEEARQAYQDAVAACNLALQCAPDIIASLNNKGNALSGLGDLLAGLSEHQEARRAYQAAVAAFDQALQCVPDDVGAYYNKSIALRGLGELLTSLGQQDEARRAYEAALAACEQALQRAPDHVYVHNSKGVALRGLGELLAGLGKHDAARRAYEAAVAAYGQALQCAPDYIYAQNNKGATLCSLGELLAGLGKHEDAGEAYQGAVAAFDEALLLAPNNAATHSTKGAALCNLADLLVVLRHHEQARRVYQEAIAACDVALLRAPDYVSAYNNKGNALRRVGELLTILGDHDGGRQAYENAVEVYDEGLQRAPDHAYLHSNRAEMLMLLGCSDTAEADISWALEHSPHSGLTRANLGQLLLVQGRFAEAEQEFRRLVDAGAANWQGFRALALLTLGRAGEARTVLDRWLETASAHDRFEACLWLTLLPESVRDTEAAGAFRDRLGCG